MKIYLGKTPAITAKLTLVNVKDFKDLYKSFFEEPLKGSKHDYYITIAKEVEITKGDSSAKNEYEYVDHYHRNNDTQITAQFVPFDGDSSTTDPHSCIPISEVKSALDSLGYKYILYTTHSHSIDKNRWRALIPCLINDRSKLDPTVTRLFNELKSLCPNLKLANEAKTWSQPWFIALRDDPDDGLYESYFNGTGRDFIAVDAPAGSSRVSSTSSSSSTSGSMSEAEMVRVIVKGVKSEDDEKGLHETFNKYIYCRTVQGMQPGALKPLLHGLSSNWDLSDKRLSDRKKDIDRLVDQAAKKFAKDKLAPNPDKWEIPKSLNVSIEDTKQIEFPVDILPESIRSAAQHIADFNLCTIHDTALSVFPVISAAIGRKLLIQAGTPGIEVYPNLGVINVADTGAFKSTIHRMLTKSLMDAINTRIGIHNEEAPLIASKISILETKIKKADNEAANDKDANGDIRMIFKALAKSNSDRQELERLLTYRNPNIIADDTTMEQMAIQGFESGGEILIVSSEGQAIFRAFSDSYSTNKSNTDLLIKGLSGDLLTRGRVGSQKSGARSRSMSYTPVINMSFFVQPDIYKDQFLYNASIHSSGMAARIITHIWKSDFNKMKEESTYEIDESKLKPYWESIYEIAMVDDRDEKYKFQLRDTIDSHNKHMIRPISIIKYDTRYKQVYLKLFNKIRKRQAKGGDLEGKGESINKCLTLSYSMAACLKVVKKGAKFFDDAESTFDTDDMRNVEEIVNYLIKKKTAEFKLLEASSKVASARALLKVLTRKAQLENSLKGISPSIFDRLTKTSKADLKKQYTEGEIILREMGYTKLIDDKIVLNPRWDDEKVEFFE